MDMIREWYIGEWVMRQTPTEISANLPGECDFIMDREGTIEVFVRKSTGLKVPYEVLFELLKLRP